MEGFFHLEKDSLSGCRVLVVPLLSVGNVPQLAVDLIVMSLSLTRVGIVVDPLIEPMCSSAVYGDASLLSFACEIFRKDDAAFLQIRSKIVQNGIGKFCGHLAQFVRQVGFEQVIILGSCDIAWLDHPDIDGLKVKYQSNHGDTIKVLDDMGLKPLIWTKPGEGQPETMTEAVFGRLTFADLLPKSLEGAVASTTGLHLFCAEGENMFEADLLTRVLLDFLSRMRCIDMNVAEFKPIRPPSWQVILEDSNPETMQRMFG